MMAAASAEKMVAALVVPLGSCLSAEMTVAPLGPLLAGPLGHV